MKLVGNGIFIIGCAALSVPIVVSVLGSILGVIFSCDIVTEGVAISYTQSSTCQTFVAMMNYHWYIFMTFIPGFLLVALGSLIIAFSPRAAQSNLSR